MASLKHSFSYLKNKYSKLCTEITEELALYEQARPLKSENLFNLLVSTDDQLNTLIKSARKSKLTEPELLELARYTTELFKLRKRMCILFKVTRPMVHLPPSYQLQLLLGEPK